MQLEVGAPPEYLDFRMRVVDDRHGEFYNMCCGALIGLEPSGPEMVMTMCHRIQDPTFDATASATHPKMRIRPVHRPPRDRVLGAIAAEVDPHWRVTAEGPRRWTVAWRDEPFEEPEEVALPASFTAAQFVHVRT